MIDIFIPSYHRPRNIKTVNYFLKIGYRPENLHVIIDNEADDIAEYMEERDKKKFNLYIFDIGEARKKYDFVHRPSVSRRAAGMSRNMFYEYAKSKGIKFYCVQDDDTTMFQIRPFQRYIRQANIDDITFFFLSIKDIMFKRRLGCFGLSQTGDMFLKINTKLIRYKVMNTTFYNTDFIYWGEKWVQDDDTSQFLQIFNEGYFSGSLASGLVLLQTPSATQKGGLTDLYNECKLLNKSLVCPIQFPSAVRAEKQKMNGNRLHHKTIKKNIMPCLMKGVRSNIEWDSYPEDALFSNLFPRDLCRA